MSDRFQLLQRYNAPTPRYTSYPPAPNWHGAHGSVLTSALRKSSAPLSIYVHIPFCERLCLYCGCNVVVKKDNAIAGPYLEHLIAEMELAEIHFDNFFRLELARLEDLERDGLIEDRMSRVLRVTPAGRIFVRAIAHVFDACQAASVASKAV